jgi:hypothetical protein
VERHGGELCETSPAARVDGDGYGSAASAASGVDDGYSSTACELDGRWNSGTATSDDLRGEMRSGVRWPAPEMNVAALRKRLLDEEEAASITSTGSALATSKRQRAHLVIGSLRGKGTR